MTSDARPLDDRGEDRYRRFVPPPSSDPPQTSTRWRWAGTDIHLLHVGEPTAPLRMLLVHGAGGNAAAMLPFATHLAGLGARVTVPDLPGYGRSRVADPGSLRYEDWRRVLVDLVDLEADARPLMLFGASMGGLLAYDTAAATEAAAAVLVTCLLDPRDPAVRDRLTWHPALARVAGPGLRVLAGPAARLRLPLRWVADLRHIANDPALVAEVLADPTGGGGRVSLGWMRSLLETAPLVEPEAFDAAPVLMVHPGEDRWTPLHLSRPFLERVAAPTELVVLEGCGHFPVEEPGFSQMLSAVERWCARLR